MIVLHNSYDRQSREFVETHCGPGDVIYDWYRGGREAWTAKRGTMRVSAFPSVVVDIPSYTMPVRDGDGNVIGTRVLPARQHPIRRSEDLADVERVLAKINAALDASSALGDDKPRLTLETMNAAETGRGG